jgi:hypothetical protein
VLSGLAAILLPGVRSAMANPPATPWFRGDANCDSEINSIDAALVLQLDADLLDSVPFAFGADANEDGNIDSADAMLILQYHAGLVTGRKPDLCVTVGPLRHGFQ